MLVRLNIRNFAIIEDIEISFHDGMNVILGETGAGKSIIIDALSLLKGEKSSFDKIRNGETKAFIEGEFVLDDKSFIQSLNEDYGDLIGEDGNVVVSRTLDTSGKSVVRINYHLVPVSLLKKIMEQIIDIHSQHKDTAYFDNKKQILFLDAYLLKASKEEKKPLFDAYSLTFEKYTEEVKKLAEMKEKSSSLEDLDYLQYQYNELEKANVQPNELEDVEAELKSLESFEELSSSMSEFDAQYEEGSNLLYNAKKALSSIKDEQFSDLKDKFTDIYYQLDEAHENLMQKFHSLADNLDHLEYLRSRRSVLLGLKRKYGRTTADILAKFDEIKNEIDLISNYDYMIAEQEKKIEEAKTKALADARTLSKIRSDYLSKLEEEVNQELHDLLLENADFRISRTESELNKNGCDEILFTLRANVGGKYLSLASTASLGETSRIHLAIKNVFNQLEPVGTIIFDEIDTGISGRVAIATAHKIKEIASSSQAIVISHLPQMAAIGDHHFFVSKVVEDGTTKTKVRELNSKEKVTEIARMISGDSESAESVKMAKNLIQTMNE